MIHFPLLATRRNSFSSLSNATRFLFLSSLREWSSQSARSLLLHALSGLSAFYLIVDRIDFKFIFFCLSINRVPLLACQPDQFEIQIQNSDRTSTSPPLIVSNSKSKFRICNARRSSLIDWSSQSMKHLVKFFLLSIDCRSRIVSSLEY